MWLQKGNLELHEQLLIYEENFYKKKEINFENLPKIVITDIFFII